MEKYKMSFVEIEIKYKADSIKLSDFKNLLEEIGYNDKKEASSFDFYYTKDIDDFMRYRESDTPELTIKRKTEENNNFNRLEIDVPLDSDRINKETVDKFANLLGYEENFSIYKTCFIYFLDNISVVWYSVYDKDMKELGKYLEIEIKKDKVENLGEQECFDTLKEFESKLSVLGITAKNRMKKSLYELYRK